jgi:hypothetical protein
MVIAALQILIAFVNLILIVRFSKSTEESDFYILANTIIGFIVAIIYTYSSTKWIAQLRKRINSKRSYSRIKTLYHSETIITSTTGFLIGLLVFSVPVLWITKYSEQQTMFAIAASCLIIFLSIFISSKVVEEKVAGNIRAAEYPGLVVQLCLLILLVSFRPDQAYEVMLFSLFAHAISFGMFVNTKNYFIQRRLIFIIKSNIKDESVKFTKVGVSATIFKSSPIIDRLLASTLNSGDVTSLGVASAIVSGVTTIYEKTVGFRHVLNTIDRIKKNKKALIIRRLVTSSLFILIGVAGIFFVESINGFFSKSINLIFAMQPENAKTTFYLITILMLTLPFQLLGPVVSVVHQYSRKEYFPMYIGAFGFGLGAIIKYFFAKDHGIFVIPTITLLIVSILFLINYLQAKKLYV